MTSTRTGARLPQSNLTGLGAVGGPQGVAAGSLRIALEFFTQYDPSAVKQLEADIQSLDGQLTAFNAQATARATKNMNLQKRISAAEQKIADADSLTRTRRFSRELRDIRSLAKDPSMRMEAQRRLTQLVADVQAAGVRLSARQIRDLEGLLGLETRLVNGKRQELALTNQIATAEGRRAGAQTELTGLQALKGGITGRLGSLAVGAIGATIGGTILAGTVFMAMQMAVEAVGTAIYENIIDPTKKSREAMEELGKAVEAVEGATDFEKATTFLKQLGLDANEATTALLAQAAAESRVAAAIEARAKIIEAAKNPEESKKRQIEEITKQLIQEDQANGRLVTTYQVMGGTAGPVLQEVADKQYYLNKATSEWVWLAGASERATKADAFAKQSLAEANNRAAFAQQLLNQQIQAGIARASASYDARIEAVPTESARTRALQARIEKAQGGGGGNNTAAQRAEIQEERALILLRMRLRAMGTAINIERYEGKFRLEAINAKIAALQKEGAAQERVNKLLELSYRMSQEITRNQGESIKDYLERRAQENRSLLAERDALRRENQIAALNEQKERVEDEVKLRELAEKEKQLAMQGTENAYIKSLQKQLEASKKRDAAEAKARKAALEKEKKEIVDAANAALEIATKEQTATWRTTLWGMDNIQDLNKVSGYLQGLYRGKAALEALVKGWGVPQWVAAPFLTQLNAQIAAYNAQKARLWDKASSGPPGGSTKIHLASGGVFSLTNSQSPFGQNVQFGEAGTEIGVVLSNRVTDQLRRMNFPQQIGPFVLNGSQDALRDQFMFKRLVRDAVAEALR